MQTNLFNSFLTQPYEQSIQAIMELNMRTLQKFSFIKPEEFTQVAKPEQIIEKNIEIMVENGHKALDYVQELFMILESPVVQMANNSIKQASQAANNPQNSKAPTKNNATKKTASAHPNALKARTTTKKHAVSQGHTANKNHKSTHTKARTTSAAPASASASAHTTPPKKAH